MKGTTYTLIQKRFLRGTLTLTIEGDKLKSEYRHDLSLRVYRFDLRSFLPDPIRMRHVPIWRIIGAILVLGFSLMYMVLGIAAITGKLEDTGAMFSAGGILLVLGVAASASAAKHAVNAVVFQGPGGQAILWPGLPSREEFDRFTTVLIERIKNARDYEQNLLRDLRRADIINDWQYDQAVELLRKDSPPGAA